MTMKALTAAAEAVRGALAEFQRIEGQQASLRQKLEEMDEQKAALTAYEERRAQLLEEALLAGQKADTAEVDKQITAAQRAIERRKDERTAIERGLATLQARREAAEVALTERKAAFELCRGEHINACLRKAVAATREPSEQLSRAIADARACLDLVPRSVAYESEVIDELQLLLRAHSPVVAAGPVTLQAQADLDRARELTGIVEEPEPEFVPAPVEYMWSDGKARPDPEPKPAADEAVRVIHARRDNPVGLVEVRRDEGYVPGLVRSY